MNKEIKESVLALMSENNIEIKSVFIPFSQSRNKDEKSKTLNYKITLSKNGRDILTTDYSMGCAHTPAYQNPQKDCGGKGKFYHMQHVKEECEKGYAILRMSSGLFVPSNGMNHKKWILPCAVDVMYSLLIDSDVLDYSDFSDWADTLGYDTDSRSDEKIYKACLDMALKLRSAINDDLRVQFNELLQDY